MTPLIHSCKTVSLVLVMILLTTLNGCHVGRFFVYNFANINDYKKFPERVIASNPEDIYHFETEIDSNILFNPYTQNKFHNVAEFETYLADNKTVALLIIHKDKIKYQWYADQWDEQSIVTSFSMSKSVISALIGIAHEEGKIPNLDAPITDYIKSFKKPGFDKITVQHLLDMRTGIDYNENYYNPFGNVAVGYYGRNLDKHISRLKIKGPPGEDFEYISIATELLGVIIEEATGQHVSQYFEEKIWTQIGTEFDASWSLDRKKGREKSFCCINARAEDFAKFASLYLHLGNWQGKQVIPEEWVKQSVQLQPDTEDNFYQNQWWLWGTSDTRHPEIVNYAAQGHLGQVMAIHPAKDLIVVRFGKQWGHTSWANFFKSISQSF